MRLDEPCRRTASGAAAATAVALASTALPRAAANALAAAAATCAALALATASYHVRCKRAVITLPSPNRFERVPIRYRRQHATLPIAEPERWRLL